MEFTTQINHTEKYDVVVVGGGVAGFTAAIAAARAGAKTALIEDLAALGGILTTGGNPEIGIFYAYYKQAISGIGWELCKRLENKGFAKIPDFSTVDTRRGGSPSNVKVNRAMCEAEMNTMCIQAGVDLYFHTKVVSAQTSGGYITSVIAAEKCGLVAFFADVFIDCTGDGDVAYLCGAQMHESDELQPGTFGFSFECKNINELDEKELRAQFNKRKEIGSIRHGDYWPEYHATMKGFLRAGGNNANHIVMDSSNAKGATKAEIEGRNAMERLLLFAKDNADISVYPPASYTAPRETRRIVCDYTVTEEDFVTGRLFEDSLSYSYYNMDLHRSTNKDGSMPFEECADYRLPDGVVPTVPLSAMTVKGFNNLLTAGRCISANRAVMGGFRVKSSCMGMGQAVGVTAALTKNRNVRQTDINKIKATLKEQGAIVPDKSIFNQAL